MAELPAGLFVTVEVPATSANLGPGFDCFGLALSWRESVRFEVVEGQFVAEVTGEGAGLVPTDASHLVIASALHGLAELGVRTPGLRVVAHNTIPQGRGLGSSSAAIVGGLLGAVALADADLDRGWLLTQADAIEGHPDNVAAAIYGGFVLAYTGPAGVAAACAEVRDDVGVILFVPEIPVRTALARGLLPAAVPHRDAAANAGRAALLVHALAREPGLLFEATRDWLHQGYRLPAMEASYALLTRLRERGYAAVISGAGPTVLVLGLGSDLEALRADPAPGFRIKVVAPGPGARVVNDPVSQDTPQSEH
jgi:homoserine kinase